MMIPIVHIVDVVVSCGKEYGIYVGLILGAGLILWKKRNLLVRIVKNKIRDDGYENYQVCSTIARALETVLWRLDADKAFLFEYRGYDKKIRPIPFATADNTVEVINPAAAITRQKENFQAVPLSSAPFWIKELSEKGQIYLPNIKTIRDEDPSTFQILDSLSIKSIYAISLISFRGTPVGFVGVSYRQKPFEMSEELLDILRCEALKIGGLVVLKHGFNGVSKGD